MSVLVTRGFLIWLSMFLFSVAPMHAQTSPTADTLLIAPTKETTPLVSRALARAPGLLATSALTFAIRAPAAWPRTARGYGQRVGDQVGFVIVETSVEALTGYGAARTLQWRHEDSSCAVVVNTRRVAQFAGRLACSTRQTLTMRTDAGRLRPNLVVAAGILAATVVSLQWRPENDTPQHARLFVLQRTAISYGARIFLGAVFPPRRAAMVGHAEHRSH